MEVASDCAGIERTEHAKSVINRDNDDILPPCDITSVVDRRPARTINVVPPMHVEENWKRGGHVAAHCRREDVEIKTVFRHGQWTREQWLRVGALLNAARSKPCGVECLAMPWRHWFGMLEAQVAHWGSSEWNPAKCQNVLVKGAENLPIRRGCDDLSSRCGVRHQQRNCKHRHKVNSDHSFDFLLPGNERGVRKNFSFNT